MKKVYRSILICLLVLLITAPSALAYRGYNVGPRTYTLTDEFHVSGGNCSNTRLILPSGETAVFDFYLPFNPSSVTLSYIANSDVQVTITGRQDYIVAFPANSNSNENPVTVTFQLESEKKGERIFKFSSAGTIQIDKIVFNKEMIETVSGYDSLFLCDLTETESAIQTAVLVDQKASMIMVNGGRRYIDNQDPDETCLTYNGRIYLPAHTLARAFSYYIEDIPERGYLLMRHDGFEYYFTNDGAFYQNFADGDKIRTTEDVRLYRNGRTYLPLRQFAEATGKTVGYRDGLAVIDDKFTVADVISDDELFNEVKALFEEFYPTENDGVCYHVAQNAANASDSNDGSALHPFKTLEKAATVAEAGDKVIVHKGVYREILSPQNDGTATAPIVFEAAEDEEVVLSANETVGGFVADPERSNVYKAAVSWDLGDGRNQVFYEDESLIEARYPDGPAAIDMGMDNEPLNGLWPVRGDFQCPPSTDETTNATVTSTTLLNQEEEDYWKGAYFVAMRGYCWTLNSARVGASSNGTLTLTDLPKNWWDSSEDASNYKKDGWQYGYIAGHINALNTAGEWVLQDKTLYLIPPQGASVSDLTVEVKKRQLVADLSESQYVQLKGFETIGGSIRMNNSEMCMLDGLSMSYLNHYILSQDQHSGYIDDADKMNQDGAPQRGEVGIYIGGKDNVVINNRMDYAAAAAIYGVGCYTYIENNIISNCGYAGSYVAGLNFSTEAWKDDSTPRGGHGIYSNTVYNAGRNVMHHTRAAGGALLPYLPEEIAFNDFHDATLMAQDAGITYEYYVLMGHEKLFTKYHHNYVYYTLPTENPYNFGIFHDGGTQNIDTYNNIVFTTQPNVSFTYSYVHSSKNGNAAAYCPQWDNSEIKEPVIGGKDALEAAHFPYGRPFYAGSEQEKTEEYLVNYKLKQNKS